MEMQLPIEQHEWRAHYYAGYEADNLQLAKKWATNVIAFWPVSGLPFYYLMGDSSTGSSIHTVIAKTTSAQETLTMRVEDRSGTAETFDEIVGNKVTSTTFNYDHLRKGTVVNMAIKLDGIAFNTPAAPSTRLTNIVYPSSQTGLYKHDTNFVFKWNSDLASSPSGDDYTSYIRNFSLTSGRLMSPEFILDQAEVEHNFSGDIFHTFKANILRGPDKSIYDDFKSGNLFNMTYRIYNGASSYIWFDCTDVGLNNVIRTRSRRQGDSSPIYEVDGVIKSISYKVKDGVADSFYGD